MSDTEELVYEDEGMDKVQIDAMQIIMFAGDARVELKSAYGQIAEGHIDEAQAYIEAAEQKITEAHHVQTEAIQATIRGEQQDYSLLFAHAQDTLMTIYSEIIVAKQLIKVFASYEARLRALEVGR